MAKVFYTEGDIEDMVKRGVTSLAVGENVVLTDLAYEKANRLGVRLMREQAEYPPGVPVRPYLSQPAPTPPGKPAAQATTPSQQAVAPAAQAAAPTPRADHAALHRRIREAVVARMGGKIDPALLDVIIMRVLNSTGVK